jgi:pyruvate dehydrogenase E1 component beta subunit
MRELTYAEAMAEGIVEAMAADDRIILFGGGFGGLTPQRPSYGVIRERFGDRISEVPISELGFCGVAIGAAMTGLRPLVSIGTGSFIYEAWPQVVNEAAVAYYGSGGELEVPVIFHFLAGLRGAGAVQHSSSPQAMLWNAPGLQIAIPSAPADAKGLMKYALLRGRAPTVMVAHNYIQGVRGPVPDGDGEIPFGVAEVKRPGTDLTIVATSIMVHRALEAAESLAQSGVSAEVVDPRTLVPLDKATILASVAKTGRVVVADETPRSCGVAAEIAAIIAEEAFHSLKAPVKRVTIPDVPVPYSKAEEDFITPKVQDIVAAAKSLVE